MADEAAEDSSTRMAHRVPSIIRRRSPLGCAAFLHQGCLSGAGALPGQKNRQRLRSPATAEALSVSILMRR